MATLAVPAPSLAQVLPPTASGTSLQDATSATPHAEGATDGSALFPQFLAALFDLTEGIEEDGPVVTPPSNLPLASGTPSAVETLLGGTHTSRSQVAPPAVEGLEPEPAIDITQLAAAPIISVPEVQPEFVPVEKSLRNDILAESIKPSVGENQQESPRPPVPATRENKRSAGVTPSAHKMTGLKLPSQLGTERNRQIPKSAGSVPAAKASETLPSGMSLKADVQTHVDVVPGTEISTPVDAQNLPLQIATAKAEEAPAQGALTKGFRVDVQRTDDRVTPSPRFGPPALPEAEKDSESAVPSPLTPASKSPTQKLIRLVTSDHGARPQAMEAPVPLLPQPDAVVTPDPQTELAVAANTPEPIKQPPAGMDTLVPDRRTSKTPAVTSSSRKSSGSVMAEVLALGGQMPRTVESVPFVEQKPKPPSPVTPSAASPEHRAGAQADVTPRMLIQDSEVSAAPDATSITVLDANTTDRDEVAFALQIKPTTEDAKPESIVKLPAEGLLRVANATPRADAPEVETLAENQEERFVSDEPDQVPERSRKERHPDVVSPDRGETPAAAPVGKTISASLPVAQVNTEPTRERSDVQAAKPAQPPAAVEIEPKPEAPKAATLRDVKLEVAAGERRVEVRLSERGGEVKMTVRTPDTHLASTLRENLPSLSARLADSGFKSEAWHPPASSASEGRHTPEASASSGSQDANSQSRQQNREQHEENGQQRPRTPQEVVQQKKKGRDFEWLISSLR